MFDFFKAFEPAAKPKISAVVVAAGQSTRMNATQSKQFIEIGGQPVLAYSLQALQACPMVDEIVTVTRECDLLFVYDLIREYNLTKCTTVVPGGGSRGQSVQNGLGEINGADIIVVHDGARPCVQQSDIMAAIDAVLQGADGGVVGRRATDTLKRVNGQGQVMGTVDRSNLWTVQTPQVFRADVLRQAYDKAEQWATDDCTLVEQMGGKVTMVEGSGWNLKVTTPDDVALVSAILTGEA